MSRYLVISGTSTAPPIILQASRVRRRIAASDAVATLVASLAYGEPRRSDLGLIASVTASRAASSAGAL